VAIQIQHYANTDASSNDPFNLHKVLKLSIHDTVNNLQ